MKIRFEVDPTLEEDEVTIRSKSADGPARRVQQYALEQAASPPKLVFYKEEQEFFLPLAEILFFETEGEAVWAHTATDAYRTKHRLYELEGFLPFVFFRSSKSTIVNTAKIYSIQRDITSASRISFAGTHKQVYASRRYYAALRQRILDVGAL
ncbi:LytTR family transcriptional regulator [Ruminococcaceae bacterium OttesenSCG-928-O06]|nr:LytTR family transcriptional regulator [Ruminococcaceae bacterium OttesenSCG-928-O06]